jgi:pilus assembly protein CpaB
MKRPAIFLILAMVAAVLAAIVVFSALKNREAQVQVALAQSQDIVVAARDVHLGEKLTAADVKMVHWSRDSVPQGAFTDPSMVGNSFVGNELVTGQPVTQRSLIPADKVPGVMPMIISPGMRAMSVAVDEVGDIAGFVKPRTHVDVLVAVSGTGTDNRPYSKIVLQNIEVIAVAQQIDKGKDEPEVAKVVTLLVTPHDAEKLGLASRDGALRLAMRNYNDDKMVPTPGSDFADLLGTRAGETAPAFNAQPSVSDPMPHRFVGPIGRHPFAVEILRDGKNEETVSFVSAGGNGISSHQDSPIAAPAAPQTSVVPATPEDSSAPVSGPVGNTTESGAASASYLPAPKTLEVP